jgi:hypothetical protein
MDTQQLREPVSVAQRIRAILLQLAHREDELAADLAASVPYWRPRPETAVGHSAAAAALRDEADRYLYAVSIPAA